MKTEHRVLALSIILALALWFSDALLHYLFLRGSLPATLDPARPEHDVYIRFLASAYVLMFGIVISVTISQRRRAEEALRESERRYRELAESIGDVFLAVDKGSRVTYWNKASERLTGISAQDAMGRLLFDLLPEMKDSSVGRVCLETLATQQPRTVTSERQEGGMAPALEFDIYPSHNGLSIFVRDITEHRRADREREELIFQLQDALTNVKTLKGLLPICANCKRIRDDQGYWRTVETYVRDHTEAEFTHGLCPDCARKLYPDYVEGRQSLRGGETATDSEKSPEGKGAKTAP